MIQLAAALEEQLSRRVNKDFPKFLEYINRNYSMQWFHDVIARKCQAVAEGKIKRLMVFVPPQHGKSEITSRMLPAWILGREPQKKIIIASYSATLAHTFSRDAKRAMQTSEYVRAFGYLVGGKGFTNASDMFETTRGGFIKAVGVGGSLTGTPADIAIIDDPVKDALEAYSGTYRERVWEWYLNVLETRLHNNSSVILIMTRWHEDDLAGRLLKAEPGMWDVISLPAIKEGHPSEIDSRQDGEALWEAKHSIEKLRRTQLLSPRTFAALLQQRPSIDGGNIVKAEWFRSISFTEFERMKENAPIVFFADTAYTSKRDNDPTGIIATCKIGGTLYIVHGHKVLYEFPQLCRWLPDYVVDNGYTAASTIRIEPKANGLSVIQQIRELTDLNVMQTAAPSESKDTRLHVASAAIEAGKVCMVDGSWNNDFITEVCGFPAQPHDEYVDVLCYAIDYHITKAGVTGAQLTGLFH